MEEQTTKHIWIPSSETHCRLTQDGTLTVWEDMTMQRRPIAAQGFGAQPPGAHFTPAELAQGAAEAALRQPAAQAKKKR